ncbi:MAG: DUF948 domain-containing protein [bacterium]|nr:DUF948 domain-containing protein [bacterium]
MYSSLDILYLVLAIGFLWISIFLCLALYQFGGFFKRANRIIDATTKQVERVQEAIETLRDGMHNAMTYAGWAAKGGEFLMEKFTDTKKKKKGKES